MDNRRYYGLDALRSSMMLLGIVLHGASFYLVEKPPGMPVPTDRNNAHVFDLIFNFIHQFRMPMFFLMSGFFASLLIDKRGMWGTYKNRAARVLAPLLVSMVTILPLAGLFAADFMLSARFGTHHLLPDRLESRILDREIGEALVAAGAPVGHVPLLHLWFLYYLCFFYLLVPLCRLLVWLSRPYEAELRRLGSTPITAVLFSLFTALSLWPFRGGQGIEGVAFLTPHVPSLIYFGMFFVCGYVFHAYREILYAAQRHVLLFAVAASILFPLSQVMGHLDRADPGQWGYTHLMAVLVHGLSIWALIYLLIGVTQRFLDYESPWILYVSQSSYWVYLTHLPVICLAAWWMVQYDLPATFKFLCVCSFTTIVCFITYHYVVQKTWISVFLNGKRFSMNWPWQDQPLESGGDR